MLINEDFRPASSIGTTCSFRECKGQGFRKVEEVIFSDDPHQLRHPFTAYVCLHHFKEIMGLLPPYLLEVDGDVNSE